MTDEHIKQIATGFHLIDRALRAEQWRIGEDQGLTPTQLSLLNTLIRRGALRITTIAQELAIAQPTASDCVTALQEKGLVARIKDPSDGRASLIKISEDGLALVRGMDTTLSLLDVIERLGETDLAGLNRSLSLIIRALQAQGSIVAQKHCLTCRYFRPHVHQDAAAPHHCDFVDAAFGDARLRHDCGDHETAATTAATDTFRQFANGGRWSVGSG